MLNAIMIDEIYAVKGKEIQNCQIAGSCTTSRRPDFGVWKSPFRSITTQTETCSYLLELTVEMFHQYKEIHEWLFS